MAVSITNRKFYADNLYFSGWPGGQEDGLRSILADVYSSSSTGHALLDKIENVAPFTGVDIIKINFRNSNTDTDTANVYLNLHNTTMSTNPTIKFTNKNGNIYTAEVINILIHELIHAIDELDDPDADMSEGYTPPLTSENIRFRDTYGDTVRKTSVILAEMGMDPQRAGYQAVLEDSSEFYDYTSFTDGQSINQAINLYGVIPTGAVDVSPHGDLILGTTGSDVVFGNTGNDFLYGGKGIDELSGSGGEDNLYGGDGED